MKGFIGGAKQGGWQRQKDSWGMNDEQSPLCHHLVSARGCCEMVAVAAGKSPSWDPFCWSKVIGKGERNRIPQTAFWQSRVFCYQEYRIKNKLLPVGMAPVLCQPGEPGMSCEKASSVAVPSQSFHCYYWMITFQRFWSGTSGPDSQTHGIMFSFRGKQRHGPGELGRAAHGIRKFLWKSPFIKIYFTSALFQKRERILNIKYRHFLLPPEPVFILPFQTTFL